MGTRAQRIGFAGLMWIAGCNALAGIEDGTLREPSFCTTLADCVVSEPACRTAVACAERRCVYEDQPEDTPLAEQVPGDCAQLACDGAGRRKLLPDSDDVQDDGDACTLDECFATTPRHTHKAVLPCYTGPQATRRSGRCADGLQQCDAAGNSIGGCEGQVLPDVESCLTPLDEDCDGLVNEEGAGCVCVPGELSPCYTGPPETMDVGECHAGTALCSADGLSFVSSCSGEQTPATEVCDTQHRDEDCNGAANEREAGCGCGDGVIDPANGEQCDDGNQDSSDGCTVLCALPACGDGYLQPTWEDCDDGNVQDGDGCPASCLMVPIPIHALVAGSFHTCAVFVDGRVKCWGANFQGELGVGDTMAHGDDALEMGSSLPLVDLGTGESAAGIGAGDRHTCALLQGGRVKCWGIAFALGIGASGDIGDGPGELGDALATVDLGTGKTAASLSVGDHHSCVLLDDGTVKCWGHNDAGQLGQGDTETRGDAPAEKEGCRGDRGRSTHVRIVR